MAKNIYTHSIELKTIIIKNAPRNEFAKKLVELPYRGYEVENIVDGRKIVITKPGGKSVYGHPKKDDFLVFIYNPADDSLWQVSHKQIYQDLVEKSKEDAQKTKELINLFEKVLNGIDPDDIIDDITACNFQSGELPEVLIKAYKWIWGQEDVNYPSGDGRNMSWKPIAELRDSL